MLRLIFVQLRRLFVDNGLDLFPIRKELRGYTGNCFIADLRAAFTVLLLTIPQGMAYAMLAGLDNIYLGITCSAVASFVGPLLAGSRYTMFGPTNATAFLIFTALSSSGEDPALIPLLVFLVGLILVMGAYLRVADLIQYVSRSVVVGYLTGAAILIIINQSKHLFGISLAREDGQTFIRVIMGLFKNASSASWQPIAVSAVTIALYYLLRRFWKTLAFPITLVTVTASYAILHQYTAFTVPDFSDRPFSIDKLIPTMPHGIATRETLDHISILFGTALGVAFLAALETSVMGKTLTSRSGERGNVNQDMLGLGAANLATAFLSGMPASGSLTRSALNFHTGAKTRVSSLLCALFCVLSALCLGPAMSFIPKACLASLVICVAFTLINRRNLRICLNATGSDAAVLVTTISAALVSRLDTAIFLGTAVSIALYLKKASKPYLAEYEFNQDGHLAETGETLKRQNPAISIVHVEGELFFGAAELFRTQIQFVCSDPNIRVIILRLKNARHLDATSVMALEDLIRFMRSDGRHILISGASSDVYQVLKNSGLLDVLDDDLPEHKTEKSNRNLFLNNPNNPNLSTRDALIRAQQVIGDQEADIRIFFDPTKDAK